MFLFLFNIYMLIDKYMKGVKFFIFIYYEMINAVKDNHQRNIY
jgi:hypothetical protein